MTSIERSGLSQLNGAARPDLIRDESLGTLFAESVAQHGNRIALADEARELTYTQLSDEADLLAAYLQSQGAKAGQFLGLWMPRGSEVLIAQLAIAKTGAAWIPFDAEAPIERVLTCLEDIGAIGVVTTEGWRERFAGMELKVLTPADEREANLPGVMNEAGPEDPAYSIYTSGSTGKPKGIVITQRNICHFLRAGQALYDLSTNDVMLQTGSIAFDLSLEEVWVPWHAGAALRVPPPGTASDPDQLAAFLSEKKVTALDIVPTLLSLINDDLPTVKLIILGGEACPEALVTRFATNGRRLINSYGPSEATVVATAAELVPGKPVTIGRPLANMTAYVVDEAMNLMPRGQAGELLLGGPGIAQGYVNRPELTAEKFVPNPFDNSGIDPILYHSGDAVEMTEAGDILFRGRIDDQVKVRGFRIELGEIETLIVNEGAVAQAAVVVNKTQDIDQLVAYAVAKPKAIIDWVAIRGRLRDQLPPYMIPAALEVVEALPILAASGKVDRKALAARALSTPAGNVEQIALDDPVEAALLTCAVGLFPGQVIAPDADFFLDLGGHSLLAAQFVTAVRQKPELAHITLGNIYDGRTLHGIANLLKSSGIPSPAPVFQPVPLVRRFFCGLAQAVVMPIILTLMSAPWLAIFISYTLISGEETSLWLDIILVFFSYMAANIFAIIVALIGKWIILGRTRPGIYPMWGVYYFRVWLSQRLVSLAHLKWFQNSPVLPMFLNLLGARVGKGAMISDFDVGAVDLLDIGENAVVGSKVVFANARVEGNRFIVGPIKIGADAQIGSTCSIEENVIIGDGAELDDLSAVPSGKSIPAWDHWGGSPMSKVGTIDPKSLPELPVHSDAWEVFSLAMYTLMLFVIPAIGIIPIVPAFRIMEWVDKIIEKIVGYEVPWDLPFVAMIATGTMIAITLFLVVVARWTLMPRMRSGTYRIDGALYMRRWGVGLLTEVALDFLSSLFATVYMRAWYRMMGAKIGKGTEISTSFAGRYDLIELGEGNFIADDVVLGDDALQRGWMTLEPLKTGDRVFVGNEAVVAQGFTIENDALVGVKSRPPSGGKVREGETWFGSPPISLPVRQRFVSDSHDTFEPPLRRKLGRAAFEAVNMCIPNALFITLVTIVMDILSGRFDEHKWLPVLTICVIASPIIAFVQLLVAAAFKWMMMGVYRPTIRPMWSWWSLRTEAVAVMYWGMAGKVLLEHFRGTPFLPWALRLFGAKTGKGIFMDTPDLTEFDCVTIGDHVAINNHSCLQTHLYEDRLMKVGKIVVGDHVTIGAGSTVLYDTQLGAGAMLGPLTMIMKGESIPPATLFAGSPAKPVTES